jgi:hypothetical protein
VQKNCQTTKHNDHDQAHPLHCIDFAVAIVNPQNLADGSYHSNDSSSVDITKLKGDKEEDDGK